MPWRDVPIERKYYSPEQVANMYGIYTSALRYWETVFPQLNPKRNRNNIRRYTKADIEVIDRIYNLLKVEGYTIKGALRKMEE